MAWHGEDLDRHVAVADDAAVRAVVRACAPVPLCSGRRAALPGFVGPRGAHICASPPPSTSAPPLQQADVPDVRLLAAVIASQTAAIRTRRRRVRPSRDARAHLRSSPERPHLRCSGKAGFSAFRSGCRLHALPPRSRASHEGLTCGGRRKFGGPRRQKGSDGASSCETESMGGGSAWESNPPRTPLSARHRF